MAARKEKITHDDKKRFYVYRFIDDNGIVAYVGKGSGERFSVQFRKLNMTGDIISWHSIEKSAYAEEVKAIARLKPYMNKCKGGNGPMATPAKRVPRDKFYVLCDKIGTRAVAARICLSYSYMFDVSKIEPLRKIAYG